MDEAGPNDGPIERATVCLVAPRERARGPGRDETGEAQAPGASGVRVDEPTCWAPTWAFEPGSRSIDEGLASCRRTACLVGARLWWAVRVEADVGELGGGPVVEESQILWTPPQPALSVTVDFPPLELVEVQVFYDEDGPQLKAAIELVS